MTADKIEKAKRKAWLGDKTEKRNTADRWAGAFFPGVVWKLARLPPILLVGSCGAGRAILHRPSHEWPVSQGG